MSKFNEKNDNLKHLQHYPVLENDISMVDLEIGVNNRQRDMPRKFKDYIPETVQITDSWFNVSDTGGFQHQHYHAATHISGVYYVNFDAEKGHCPTSFTKDERSLCTKFIYFKYY